jgi:hypothetical protein
MSVFYYNPSPKRVWDGWIVLWDGENTYWTEEMKPSGGYSVRPDKRKPNGRSFYYIGEL